MTRCLSVLLGLLWSCAALPQIFVPALRASVALDPDSVVTYNAITDHTSDRYTVTVAQNGNTPHDSPVLYSQNDHTPGAGNPAYDDLTEQNHWTKFEFEGPDDVQVVVNRIAGSITSATIHPTSSGITASIVSGDVHFSIPPPVPASPTPSAVENDDNRKYWVEINGQAEYPLFVFAHPLDTFNTGTCNGTTVVCWLADTDEYVLDTYTGGADVPVEYEADYGQTLYIEGGAWVEGLINVDASGSGVFSLLGRGTLSSQIYYDMSGETSYRQLEIANDAAGSVVVEGITFTDSQSHIIVSFDDGPASYTNLELFGWKSTTDGIRSGGDCTSGLSVVDDIFFKVDDDVVKTYHSCARFDELVVWMQKSGTMVQFSWALTGDVTDVIVDDVDVIWNDRPLSSAPGTSDGPNNSIVGSRNIEGAVMTDITISNVRIETQPWQLFSMHVSDDAFGTGSISDITILNWTTPAPDIVSTFASDGDVSPGPCTVRDFHFTNVTVGGSDLDSGDLGGALTFSSANGCSTDNGSTFDFAP